MPEPNGRHDLGDEGAEGHQRDEQERRCRQVVTAQGEGTRIRGRRRAPREENIVGKAVCEQDQSALDQCRPEGGRRQGEQQTAADA